MYFTRCFSGPPRNVSETGMQLHVVSCSTYKKARRDSVCQCSSGGRRVTTYTPHPTIKNWNIKIIRLAIFNHPTPQVVIIEQPFSDGSSYLELDLLAFLCVGHCDTDLLFLRALTTFPTVNYTVLSRAYLSIPSLTSVHQSVSVSTTPLPTADDASGRYRGCWIYLPWMPVPSKMFETDPG